MFPDMVYVVVPLFILLGIVIRVVAGDMDRFRIETYMRERGCRLLEKRWAPFGPGHFGSKNERIYEVKYRDHQGEVRQAHLKTSMFSGVYLTEDRPISTNTFESYKPVSKSERQGDLTKPTETRSKEELQAEIDRLCAELERLDEHDPEAGNTSSKGD